MMDGKNEPAIIHVVRRDDISEKSIWFAESLTENAIKLNVIQAEESLAINRIIFCFDCIVLTHSFKYFFGLVFCLSKMMTISISISH